VGGRKHSLSAIIIARDEQASIGRCLAALERWVDEIVVVDGGSTDDTAKIARGHGARVIESAWLGFGRQKQLALDAAGGAWVLSVDADEVVTEELRREIDEILSGEPPAAGFHIPRSIQAFGARLDHGECGQAPLRLFRREGARFTDAEVHERVIVRGKVGELRSRLLHYSIRDLKHQLDKLNRYAWLWAQERHRRGERAGLGSALAHGLWSFIEVYFFRRGVLDGRLGLTLALLQSQYTFNKYAALWTLGLEPGPRVEAEDPRGQPTAAP
jgi:(heptosyl)LPS beta-1,4-glucosyltransferase